MSPIRLGMFWFPLSFNTFSMGEVSYTDQKSHNIREKNRDHICLLTLSQMLPFHPFPAVLWTTSLHWGSGLSIFSVSVQNLFQIKDICWTEHGSAILLYRRMFKL